MDGDLSLSQSLGGLRIANPDDASTSSLSTSRGPSRGPSVSPLSMPTSPLGMGEHWKNAQIPPINPESWSGPGQSQLDFDPSSFSTDTVSQEKSKSSVRPSPPSPKRQLMDAHRPNDRQPLPPTYQDQQHAQFPQYSTMVPQSRRHPNSASRPTSMLYSQSSADSGGSLPARNGSHQMRKEASFAPNTGMPRRTSSRGAGAAMQAGVPTREGSHSERSYRNTNGVHNGNGPLPPRRSSRGMGVGRVIDGNTVGTAHQSGSPYNIEGGPAASSEEWQDRGAYVGIRHEIDSTGQPVQKYIKKGVKDFHFGRALGDGSYSTVLAATDRQTLQEFAIKVLDKGHIIKEKKVKYVNIEKDTLNRLKNHPGVIRLHYTFQDERSLYFVLDICTGGELLGVLKKMTTFNEECTRFYGAQILDTIDYMHSRGVIHRDLKPENVLLDEQMHVKVTDFGTAKILKIPKQKQEGVNGSDTSTAQDPLDGADENRANSFVGTAEYVSPELLTEKNACKASDLWAFGCIIYQLLAGRPPFKAGNEYQTFQKIVALDYQFPQGFPPSARDLVERLLVLDPARRLSIDHVKNHEFFHGIVWGRELWRQKAPRLKSYVPRSSDSAKVNTQETSPTNGNGITNGNNYPAEFTPSHSTKAAHIPVGSASNGPVRPTPRVITELPPPSQLDIEWSPVLTRNNERILKLGNLLVLSAPAPHSPIGRVGAQNGDVDAPSKFSRFFGGGTTKKRQRLVMVTSSARVIMVAAGGDEKKTKTEFSLLTAGCSWRKMQDPKGLAYWVIDTVRSHVVTFFRIFISSRFIARKTLYIRGPEVSIVGRVVHVGCSSRMDR